MRVTVKNPEGGVYGSGIGYFDHVRRRPGDVFDIPDEPRRKLVAAERRLYGEELIKAIEDKDGTVPVAFSFRWMEPVAEAIPERVTTAPEALKEFHDKTIVERAGRRGTGSQEVI